MKNDELNELNELLGISGGKTENLPAQENSTQTPRANGCPANDADDFIETDELIKALEAPVKNEQPKKTAVKPKNTENAENTAKSAAELYQLGVKYYDGKGVKQDLSKAVKYFLEAAKQGYAPAQRRLGYCYSNGYGVEKNHGLAVKWYTLAAEQGNADAQCDLGVCYHNGENVIRDYTKAFWWYFRSAEQGCAHAQYLLGLCYYYGEGTPKSFTQAKKWLTLAAKQGHEEAKIRLQTLKFSV
ncbi:MAG: sel1 repeat family protein [Clostridia bacterium]|nr:sel1 repeat family protein [Clostridia bacterium]